MLIPSVFHAFSSHIFCGSPELFSLCFIVYYVIENVFSFIQCVVFHSCILMISFDWNPWWLYLSFFFCLVQMILVVFVFISSFPLWTACSSLPLHLFYMVDLHLHSSSLLPHSSSLLWGSGNSDRPLQLNLFHTPLLSLTNWQRSSPMFLPVDWR